MNLPRIGIQSIVHADFAVECTCASGNAASFCYGLFGALNHFRSPKSRQVPSDRRRIHPRREQSAMQCGKNMLQRNKDSDPVLVVKLCICNGCY